MCETDSTDALYLILCLFVKVREGELVFGVAHIYASFNDTFVHITDLSGRETICRYFTFLYES